MRQKINENPMTQVALVGVLLVVVGFLFVTRVMKKDEPAPAVPVTGAAVTTAPVATTPTGTTADPTAAVPVAAVPAALPTTPLGPPLPAGVRQAQAAGKAIVLLVVREGGIEDRLVSRAVSGLSGDPGLEIFVADAANVARYARITQPLGVDRVPALVVLRPSSAASATPEGHVTYGFRSAESVVQAVRDALYSGPTVPYSPD